MKLFYLLRGVSGAGKSTVAQSILSIASADLTTAHYEADMYFTDDEGNYNWDPKYIRQSHEWCRDMASNAVTNETNIVIVSNTSTSQREFSYYEKLAKDNGYTFMSLVVENRHGNNSVHNVPDATRQKQANKLKNSLKLI